MEFPKVFDLSGKVAVVTGVASVLGVAFAEAMVEHGQVYTRMKPDKVIVDVPDFLVSGERYSNKGLLAGIPPGIRVSHLNNFATLLDLMGVPISLRVCSYDKSIFSLTAEDKRCVIV